MHRTLLTMLYIVSFHTRLPVTALRHLDERRNFTVAAVCGVRSDCCIIKWKRGDIKNFWPTVNRFRF